MSVGEADEVVVTSASYPRYARPRGRGLGGRTKLTARSHDDAKVYDETIRRIPLRRWATAEEMGDAALFLASPMASYITGQMLLVDGGVTLV